MSEVKIDTIIHLMNVKEAFGTYAVLDNIAVEDFPSILQFAQIVSNYKKMKELTK